MSGRKNNELKELKTPSKKRRKTSQEESEYKKTMLENLNQNQEETKRIERKKCWKSQVFTRRKQRNSSKYY